MPAAKGAKLIWHPYLALLAKMADFGGFLDVGIPKRATFKFGTLGEDKIQSVLLVSFCDLQQYKAQPPAKSPFSAFTPSLARARFRVRFDMPRASACLLNSLTET